MPHRESIKEFVRTLHIENASVVDWGCGTKHVTRYGIFGENVKYVGIDKLEHVDADLVMDMQDNIHLEDAPFDYAFCLEVLEHVPEYEKLLENINRNLKTGGLLYMSVPFMLEVHHPEDYWRFTDIGLRYALEKHGFHVEKILPTQGKAGWVCEAVKI